MWRKMNHTIGIVLLCLFAPAVAFSGGRNEGAAQLSYEALAKLIESESDYHLVDVRTAEEFNSGHIPSAVNINVDVISAHPPTPDKSAYIIVYCRSGNRSNRAKEMLEEAGYTNVHDFGGISRWQGELITP